MGDQRRSPASLSYLLNRISCLPGSLRRRPLARLHPEKWGRLATCGGLLNPPRSSENSTPVWGYIFLDGAHRSPLIDTSFRKSAFGASPRLASFFQKERYIRRDVFSHFVSQIRLDVGRAPSPAPNAHIRLFQRSESWDGRPDSIFIRRSDRNPAGGSFRKTLRWRLRCQIGFVFSRQLALASHSLASCQVRFAKTGGGRTSFAIGPGRPELSA